MRGGQGCDCSCHSDTSDEICDRCCEPKFLWDKLEAAEAEAAALKRNYAHLDFLYTDLDEHANDLKFELAALRERERWIPVEEKLPPHVGYYLVVQANSVSPATVAYYSGSGKTWSYADVTYWKALSAAPEAKS